MSQFATLLLLLSAALFAGCDTAPATCQVGLSRFAAAY